LVEVNGNGLEQTAPLHEVASECYNQASAVLLVGINAVTRASEVISVIGLDATRVVNARNAILSRSVSEFRRISAAWDAEMITMLPVAGDVASLPIKEMLEFNPSWWRYNNASEYVHHLQNLKRLNWVGFASKSRRAVEVFGRFDRLSPMAARFLSKNKDSPEDAIG
jgi:hypothetical protein